MRLFLILFFIFCCYSGYAQQTTVEVNGTVMNEEEGEPVEQATIRLLNQTDSAFIQGTTSSSQGSFSLKKVRPGSYILHITYLGLSPFYKEIQAGQQNLELGTINLQPGSIELEGAVVTAKAPDIVVRNDTIEYHADAYKVTEGAVLEDLLKRLPGVEVDKDGKITINGKGISKILVDGKEFFSSDPKTAAQNLPADMVEKIQTYEKKSDKASQTGFDDGNEENVINLTIKPEKRGGWFGNAHAGYGSEDRYEGNAIVNRFAGNDILSVTGNMNNTNGRGVNDAGGGMGRSYGGTGLSTTGNVSTSFNKEFNPELSLNGDARFDHHHTEYSHKNHTENILLADSSTFENQSSQSKNSSKSTGAGVRIEWKPDTLTSIYIRPDFNYSWNESLSRSERYLYDNQEQAINQTQQMNQSNGHSQIAGGFAQFNRIMNSKGRVLNISLSGRMNYSTEDGTNNSLTEYFLRTDDIDKEELDQVFHNNTEGKNLDANISWVEPLGKNYFIQAEYNFQYNKQDALRNTYTKDEKQTYSMLDSAYSGSTQTLTSAHRAHISFRAQKEKYNYQIGVSIDPSYNSSYTFVGDSTLSYISYHTVNYSPNGYFMYRWNTRSNLRISYRGSSNQPPIHYRQAIPEIVNPTLTRIGNPDLKPSYRSTLALTFHHFIPEKQQVFMVSMDGQYVANDITNKTEYSDDDSGNRVTTYGNVNGNYHVNGRLMLNTPLKNRKFSLNSHTTVSYNNRNGFINTEKSSSKIFSIHEMANLTFRSERFDVEMNSMVRYNSSTNSLQPQNNRTIWNYEIGGYTTVNLPLDFKIESDLYYSGSAGYSDGFGKKEVLWNASASKSFLKNKQATVRFKIYDILQQQSNISRTEIANYISESEYNSLSSYFMVYFIYRFQFFPGGK